MAVATLEVFRVRYRAFCDRFGRDPEPDEPLFFDPEHDIPVPPEPGVIRAQVLSAANTAGVDGRVVLRFMRLDRGTRPLEPPTALPWRHRTVPERERVGCLTLAPEEPSK